MGFASTTAPRLYEISSGSVSFIGYLGFRVIRPIRVSTVTAQKYVLKFMKIYEGFLGGMLA